MGKGKKGTVAERLAKINVLAELSRYGNEWRTLSEHEIKLRCPSPTHPDRDPSVSMNTDTGKWLCHAGSCGARGDFPAFLAMQLRVDRSVVVVELSARYELGDQKVIDPRVVESMHARLHEAGPLLKALKDRGLTEAMMAEAKLGFHDGRITIPVFDERGRCVNIRRYLPGAPTADKMQNTLGFGELRLYGIEGLEAAKKVWIGGGECKAILVRCLLRDAGWWAVCATAGEGSWDPAWSRKFTGKSVVVCMDVDLAGEKSATKIAAAIGNFASDVRIVKLPLDKVKYPRGDVNDWVGQEGATAKEFLALIEASHPVGRAVQPEPGAPPERVDLGQAASPRLIGRVMSLPAVIAAMDQDPYLVPATVAVNCTKDQPMCGACAAYGIDPEPGAEEMRLRVPPTSPWILAMVNAPSLQLEEAMHRAVGVPTSCKAAVVRAREHAEVVDVRLTPKLEIGGRSLGDVMRRGFVVGREVDLNVPYEFTGTVWPHPRDQKATLLFNEAAEAADSLDSFALGEGDAELLAAAYRPRCWTDSALEEQLGRCWSDLECNVTRIHGRRDLTALVDLTFHCPYVFQFEGRPTNGWLNTLVVGDSAQGKTETTLRLMQHYGLGDRVDGKNATVAGLLGGLQQMGTRWFVSWGAVPTHDRRLVVLEEAKGLAPETWSRLTDMRSSGVAEIPKIEKRRAHARTRLCVLSNTRSGRPLAAYNFGVDAVVELIGGLEDVRRFDLCLALRAGDVTAADMAAWSRSRPTAPSLGPPGLARKLVLWCWTRRLGQSVFTQEAERAAVDAAERLCGHFHESVPLIDRGTARYKVARVAAAVAGRTFSAEGDQLVVRACHVAYAERLIESLYSSEAMGYRAYTEAVADATDMRDPAEVLRHLRATRHPADLLRQLLYQDDVTLQDVQDWLGTDRGPAQTLLSLLVRKRALVRHDRAGYRKTAKFVALLKGAQTTEEAETHDPRF